MADQFRSSVPGFWLAGAYMEIVPRNIHHDELTIGVPTVAVLFGLLSTLLVNNRWFDKVDQRFDKQNARLDRIELKMERNFEIVHADLRTFYALNPELKGRADEPKSRLEAIESACPSLSVLRLLLVEFE